ncbi:MAG: arginase family protein, partial [bacterium]
MTEKIDNAFAAEELGGVVGEPTYSGALSFARRRYSKDLARAEVAVTGVPFDAATTSRPGARFGPRAIRAASVEVAWQRNWPWEFDPFALLRTVDYG